MPYTREQLSDSVTLYCGDAESVLQNHFFRAAHSYDAVITDPVWPNNSVPEFSGINPVDTLSTVSCLWESKRDAIQLGCDSDPRILQFLYRGYEHSHRYDYGKKFFRVSWLRYARPHYKGRLLYGSDVAYLFGEPPASKRGAHVIPGEVCKTDPNGRITDHPCERSYEHVEWLCKYWSEESILDPFMGSGTTGVAAVKLGRKFVGIEYEPKYFKIACERIKQAIEEREMDMFKNEVLS